MNKLKHKQALSVLEVLHQKAAADQTLRQDLRQQAALRNESYKSDWTTAYLAVGHEEGAFLYFLATVAKAKNIVEFGCSFGISTIYLAAAAKDNGGHVITSDLESTKVEGTKQNLQDAGLSDLVEIRQGDAMQTLASIDEPIDFLFLDGAKELYLPVFEMLRSKLSPGAIVFADNADNPETFPFTNHILSLESEFSSVYLFDKRAFIAHLL